MNENLVAFIICSNNELKLNECKYYLSRLQIPEGYETDIIVVTGAVSMTEGYQEAMLSTDARYKVYLHHDTVIINEYFIRDFLSIFQSDEEIGMLGVIGCKSLPFDAYACTSWDVGKVLHNIADKCLIKFQATDKGVTEVDAIDGLLMVTQYDINWRTDLFNNWDFYDISQCYEFHRKKLKVVVPYQEYYWCYHDNDYSKMGEYDYNRSVFIKEYQDLRSFNLYRTTSEAEMSKLQFQMKDMFGTLIKQGKIEEVFLLINQDTMLQELGCLRDYTLAMMIHKAEQDNQTKLKLDLDIMDEHELVSQLYKLKFLLKRVEFHCDGKEDILKALIDNYSIYAIYYSIIYHVRYRKDVLNCIYQYCRKVQKIEVSELIHRMMQVTQNHISVEE